MEPGSIIATALALGAAAGLKSTAEQAVKDVYSAVKAVIARKFASVSLANLEHMPDSTARRAVERDLVKVGADKDDEVLRLATELIEAVEAHTPEAARTIGVDLEEIKAASLEIERVTSSGTGVHVKGAEVQESVTIRDVHAGVGDDDPPKE